MCKDKGGSESRLKEPSDGKKDHIQGRDRKSAPGSWNVSDSMSQKTHSVVREVLLRRLSCEGSRHIWLK